jgi:hypothetical protein
MTRSRRARQRANRARGREQLAELGKLFTGTRVQWQDGPPVRVTLPAPLLIRQRWWHRCLLRLRGSR